MDAIVTQKLVRTVLETIRADIMLLKNDVANIVTARSLALLSDAAVDRAILDFRTRVAELEARSARIERWFGEPPPAPPAPAAAGGWPSGGRARPGKPETTRRGLFSR